MAKSRGAAWAVWLQADKLTVCTRSIQSNTQLSQQAKFPGAHSTYVRSRGDVMYLLILRRSQSSPFSLLYSTLWKTTGLSMIRKLCIFSMVFANSATTSAQRSITPWVGARRQGQGLSSLLFLASADSIFSKGHLWMNWNFTDHVHSRGFWDFVCLRGARKLKIWGPIILPWMENTF